MKKVTWEGGREGVVRMRDEVVTSEGGKGEQGKEMSLCTYHQTQQ